MEQRTYNQYCAAARTLDIVGERWTLLLVRELLTGPRRFGDLQKSLPGLGTGLLAARMKQMEREGLVQKVTLPPPARTPAYALTQAGQELGPTLMAISRWGLRWAAGERREGEHFRPGWALMGMKAVFDPEAATGLRAVYEYRIGEETFHARVEDGAIDTVHGPAQRPDVIIEASEGAYLEVASGQISLSEAITNGSVSATGDDELVRRLNTLFTWPTPGQR